MLRLKMKGNPCLNKGAGCYLKITQTVLASNVPKCSILCVFLHLLTSLHFAVLFDRFLMMHGGIIFEEMIWYFLFAFSSDVISLNEGRFKELLQSFRGSVGTCKIVYMFLYKLAMEMLKAVLSLWFLLIERKW